MTNDEIKEKSKKQYQALTSVRCPILKAPVNFNADGWYHIVFESNRRKRSLKDRLSRMMLIPLIIPVLREAKSIDEVRMYDGKYIKGDKIENCFALVATVGKGRGLRVKVIVRKTGNGGYFFHSVMRDWKTKSTP